MATDRTKVTADNYTHRVSVYVTNDMSLEDIVEELNEKLQKFKKKEKYGAIR